MDVAVIMGSKSDWETMSACADQLTEFGIEFEAKVVSAHRTPEWMVEYATTAQSRGIKVIIAAAGGAAHLPGMVSALTPLPVLGVPIKSRTLNGIDSLLSIVQMPAGVPTATFAIGEAGAKNAAIFAARLLAATDTQLAEKVRKQMDDQREKVLSDRDLGGFIGKDKPDGGNGGGQKA